MIGFPKLWSEQAMLIWTWFFYLNLNDSKIVDLKRLIGNHRGEVRILDTPKYGTYHGKSQRASKDQCFRCW